MPMLAPPTMATLALSPRSIADLSVQSDFGQQARGIVVENLVEDLRRIALGAPVVDEALVGEERIVAAEEDAVLKPARDLMLEIGGKILRRPAVQLVPDVALVHE